MNDPIPEFGIRVDGEHYRPRPGIYAVLIDFNGNVALIKTPAGWFLPGGGIDPGEKFIDALAREVREECGHILVPLQILGNAIEFAHGEKEGYIAKECKFILAAIPRFIGGQVEADHELAWVPFTDAINRLTHKSQAWAVELYLLNNNRD